MASGPSETELQELVDKQQIYDAMMRYCRGVDRCDEELMGSVYHPGATDHHGAFSGPAEEFVRAFIPGSREESTFTMHAVANFTVELDDDRAASEAYFVAYVGRMTDQGEVVDCFGGRYVDQWEKRDTGWGVVNRTVVHEWSRANGLGTEKFPLPTELFHQPVRGRDDLAFAPAGGVRS